MLIDYQSDEKKPIPRLFILFIGLFSLLFIAISAIVIIPKLDIFSSNLSVNGYELNLDKNSNVEAPSKVSRAPAEKTPECLYTLISQLAAGAFILTVFLGWLGYRIIVTPYKALEKAHNKLLILQEAVEHMSDIFIVTKADDLDKNLEIVYVNPAATQISGYSAEELIGQTPRIFQGDQTDRVALDRIRAALEKGNSISEEIINHTKKGEPYWVQINITPIRNRHGKIIYYAALESDISERKRQEEALQEAKSVAETANQTKTEFLASMSHELRTPMNGVLTSVELLLDEPLDEEQHGIVDVIHRSGKHLLTILNNILDISKVESGEIELESHPVRLQHLANELEQLFRPVAENKSIALSVEVASELPAFVMGDSTRIAQVLGNLTGNSLKFTPEGGEVSITISADQASPNLIHFTVEDTGIGIAEDKLETIFDKFSQADAATTRQYGGTGLGLAISKELVELMKGHIHAKSTLGKGSCFTFSLPMNPIRKSQLSVNTKIPSNPLPIPEDVHILLVEDYPINTQLIQKQLNKIGIKKIHCAEDGLEALKMLSKNPDIYDLILLDCQMPNLNGYETAVQIRESEKHSGSHIPIIAMTANAMVGDKEKCFYAGMDDYLSKPLKQNDLHKKLGYWLSC